VDHDDDDHDDIKDHVDFPDSDIVTKKKNKKVSAYFDDTKKYGRTEEIRDQEQERQYDDLLELVSYRDEDFEENCENIDGGDDEEIFHEDQLDHNQQFSNENEESDPLLDEFVSDSSDLTNSHYNQVSMMMTIDRLQVKQLIDL
jgi:hypothetical protein